MTAQQGFLLGNQREWPVRFKYGIKVSPFLSVSDGPSLGRPFGAEMKRGWGFLHSKQRVSNGKIARPLILQRVRGGKRYGGLVGKCGFYTPRILGHGDFPLCSSGTADSPNLLLVLTGFTGDKRGLCLQCEQSRGLRKVGSLWLSGSQVSCSL